MYRRRFLNLSDFFDFDHGIFQLESLFPAARQICYDTSTDAAKVDVKEYDDRIEVVAEIPGFSKDNVEIEYDKGHLIISGEIKKTDDKAVKFLHKETGNRSFKRKFELGDLIDTDNIKATFKDGVLTIVLPKTEDEKSRKITIN